MNKKGIALFEIIILIGASFSFAYLVSQTNDYFVGNYDEGKGIKKLRGFILSQLSGGLVSAQGLWTCRESLAGEICQEFPSGTCEDNCLESCFPGPREDFSECELGTCFDSNRGTCQTQTPRGSCENAGGQWSEQTPAVCNPGCCLIGGQAQFISETACNSLSQSSGITLDGINNLFNPNVQNEFECLLQAETFKEGACVLEPSSGDVKNNCKFALESECLSLGGDFYENKLCSNPELNTACEKQEITSCFDGEDEVYWRDSCGNRENIYEGGSNAARTRSWNNGVLLPKSESCNLQIGNNQFANQKTCGNCNYLLGSVCGKPGQNDNAASEGEYVCKDLSCVDEWGDERKHGESWCAFDGQIGVDIQNLNNTQESINVPGIVLPEITIVIDAQNSNNTRRSVDTPGSRHYRKTCFDGEVRTDPCQDGRKEVCVESRDEEIGFSSAACRINSWQLCLDANTDKNKLDKCGENTDCFLKSVAINDFKFDVCAPKHPPGFDLKQELGGEVSESICGIASQTCTYIEVKKITGRWRCKVNCDCKNKEFAETMNNLCISLGDCGAHVNFAGEITTDGYRVKNSPELSASYLNALKAYAIAKKGQRVDQLTNAELAALFGVPKSTFENDAEFAEFLGNLGTGAMGVGLIYVGFELGLSGVWGVLKGSHAMPSAFANFATAGVIGAVIGFLVSKAFGLEGEAMTLVVLGTALATAVDASIAASLGGNLATLTNYLIGTAILAAAALSLMLKLFGIGKTRKKTVEFTCLPWQPPTGGADCEKCDNGDLPCSEYKCQSLGQTCEFLNEGMGEELCVDASPNDVAPPAISPDYEVIEDDFEYTQVSNNGFKIRNKDSSDGCIKELTPVLFGLNLDKPGQCKFELVNTQDYNSMENYFDGNLYKYNHTNVIAMPLLSSLGVGGAGPDRRGNFKMHLRCQSASGHSNVQEYIAEFCVSPMDDLSPPTIIGFIPPSPRHIPYEMPEDYELFMQLITHEPADCKWGLQDKSYDEMENLMFCLNEIDNVGCYNTDDGVVCGWSCNAVLDIQQQDETNYYFRCKDQPWLGTSGEEEGEGEDAPDAPEEESGEEAGRNPNTQSEIYNVKKTTEPLVINSVTPNGETIVSGASPVSAELEIATSGGLDGNAFCSFSFNNNNFIGFFNTGGRTHRQTFNTLFAGDYNINLYCEDLAGNTATSNSVFSIEIDDSPPQFVSVYNLGGTLRAITNEPATCEVSYVGCGFNFGEGTQMSGQNLLHTSSFDQGSIHYVKCRDAWENTGICLPIAGGY